MIIDATALAGHPFLAGLPASQLDVLAPLARPESYNEGVRLFREDAPAAEFWLVRTGQVALDIHLPGRGTVPLETIGTGGVVGWSWLFPPYRWAFGAVAARQIEAFEFDARMVRACCQDDPELGYDLTQRLARVLAKRLQATRVRLITASSLPAALP